MDPNTSNAVTEGGHTSPAVNRPRGRPPGSKNRPKPTPYPADALRALPLEVKPGENLFSCLVAYASANKRCVGVFDANGYVVGNLSFSDSGPILQKPFQILKLSGVIFPPDAAGTLFMDEKGTIFPAASGPAALTLVVAGDGAKPIFVGMVEDSLIAYSTVRIVAYTFPKIPVDTA